MKKSALFLLLSLSFVSVNIRAMEDSKPQTNSLTDSFGVLGETPIADDASMCKPGSKSKQEFIEPQEVLRNVLETRRDTPLQTLTLKKIHKPLLYFEKFNKIWKGWFVDGARADGQGVNRDYSNDEISPDEDVWVTLALLSALYVCKHNNCYAIVTHEFKQTLNNWREYFKKRLNLTEVQMPQPTPKNVLEALQQRFHGQEIVLKRACKNPLENLIITENKEEDRIEIMMNEDFINQNAKPTAPNNFSMSSFLLGSCTTTLGIVSILYAPKLYHWLYNR